MSSRRRLLIGLLVSSITTAVVHAEIPTRDQVDQAAEMSLPEDPAAVIAVVGRSPILMGDILPKVEARINEVTSKTNQTVPPDQLHFVRLNLVRTFLVQAVQNKMMRESFLLDQVGTQSAEAREEADAKLTARARQMFFETELPELKKQYEASDLNELDEALREKGTSLAARQRDFVDAMLGHLYIRTKVERDPAVSIAEIAGHYDTNKEEFHRPSRARWEQLTVLFKNHPSRDAAYRQIWKMGRDVIYAFGGNVEPVAKASSEEPFAKDGGVHDWTAKGSLASTAIDEQIFSIPLNAMSEIIEDEQGFHIVRVLERHEAGYTPLSEVQDDIRATIREQKIMASQRKLMSDIKDRIPVWSLFPDDLPAAKPLPESITRRNQPTKTR